ncbi:alpha-hydroxy acid oxidase [Gloeothece verrucosa]|uniref:FMN-dependent alpha-hydroxy acid dehydrogenase n=1 Tax=Gloeothece verrucosa (strain PCC 7822) TaxID=497965 RepID=E0U5Y2_GLOV7|nr:alpha-hydroxy acid oxidase [Gloeothece verrucosa]ADN17091.1 FMN-dependent alpha-hydroxy acid dehydrogenase [Gloeothece verrucosa PCC 7822]
MTQPINVFEYETLAKNQLSEMAWGYYSTGALDQITLGDNRAAYERYRLRPRMLVDVSQRDLSVSILGQSLSRPILIAPMAFQCLAHPEGEIATARAATEAGMMMVLSTLSTQSLEEVAATGCPRWFQLYVHKDRGLTKALVQRAESMGYQALCVTVDAPFIGRREADVRNEFTLPKGLKLANLLTMADVTLPDVPDDSGLFAYFKEQIDPSLTWKDLEWLQSMTKLPVVVKGILRADDALLAVQHGVKGIIVSNHGGRQLDGAIASLDALQDITDAVGEQVEVLMDGGIRRGTDILKALALGAKAVLVGRPILWGLAVGGQAGVSHVLQLLTEELELAMALSGCPRIGDIDSSLVEPRTIANL